MLNKYQILLDILVYSMLMFLLNLSGFLTTILQWIIVLKLNQTVPVR